MGRSGTFMAADAVELATVSRGGFIESRHIGSAAVVDGEGEPIALIGDTSTPVFPRSTMKFLQTLAALDAGAPLDGEHLAIACASHSGTPLHVALVRDVLGRAGLDETALQCPPAWPADRAARDALIRSGEPNAPIYMECSGKHAAFLAACREAGWPTDSYLDAEHPLQRRIAETVGRFGGGRIDHTSVDGCGAPVHTMPLVALARSMARFATAQESSPFAIFRHAAQIRDAVIAHPTAMSGAGRPDTVLIEQLGIMAKFGAEGVYVAATREGVSVALKYLDGTGRGAPLVALQLLVAAGAVAPQQAEQVLPHLGLEVLGGGRVVGHVNVGAGVPVELPAR